jgi:hypothetical protein
LARTQLQEKFAAMTKKDIEMAEMEFSENLRAQEDVVRQLDKTLETIVQNAWNHLALLGSIAWDLPEADE